MGDTYANSEFLESGIFLTEPLDTVPGILPVGQRSSIVLASARTTSEKQRRKVRHETNHAFGGTGVPSAIVVTPFRSTIIP